MKQKQAAAQPKGIKEFIRKFLVSLKRSPQNIALVALAVAFLVYSLNMTSISHTTERVNSANMGQCQFVAMLFSILAFVVFLRSFPKRQKPNTIMVTLLFVMLAGLVAVDCVYLTRITQAMNDSANPLIITDELMYIQSAQSTVTMHIIFVVICAVLIATLPVYGKLIKKINTSIEVEGNGEMDVIDISGED